MSFQGNRNQRTVLDLLLDKYENSKTYTGNNIKKQSFSIKPEAVYKNYRDNFADVSKISDFEQDMQVLEREGLIRIVKGNNEIKNILAMEEKIPEYYKILQRTEKKDLLSLEKEMYQSYLGKNTVLDGFCRKQLAKLEKGNKPDHSKEKAGKLLALGLFVLENNEELLERELSIRFFGDTKIFERSYRSAVCKILEEFGDYQEKLFGVSDIREKELVLLGEHNISANPSYIYVKGEGEFTMGNGNILCITPEYPIAFSSDAIKNMKKFTIKSQKIMTIENLTSFHRIHAENTFYIYLSGYHNTLKKHFIMSLAKENPKLKWYHFGDLDPDGFCILEHLKRETGIPFEPFHMGLKDLKEFQEYGKELNEIDRKKAHTLINAGLYCRELSYMLSENIKLEQEIIGWNL